MSSGLQCKSGINATNINENCSYTTEYSEKNDQEHIRQIKTYVLDSTMFSLDGLG